MAVASRNKAHVIALPDVSLPYLTVSFEANDTDPPV
jgi:hypothetical protein